MPETRTDADGAPLCPRELQPLVNDIVEYCRKHGERPIYGGNLEMRAAIWLHHMQLGWLTMSEAGQAVFQTDRVPVTSVDRLARRSVQ